MKKSLRLMQYWGGPLMLGLNALGIMLIYSDRWYAQVDVPEQERSACYIPAVDGAVIDTTALLGDYCKSAAASGNTLTVVSQTDTDPDAVTTFAACPDQASIDARITNGGWLGPVGQRRPHRLSQAGQHSRQLGNVCDTLCYDGDLQQAQHRIRPGPVPAADRRDRGTRPNGGGRPGQRGRGRLGSGRQQRSHRLRQSRQRSGQLRDLGDSVRRHRHLRPGPDRPADRQQVCGDSLRPRRACSSPSLPREGTASTSTWTGTTGHCHRFRHRFRVPTPR